jgi:hypothetical protein
VSTRKTKEIEVGLLRKGFRKFNKRHKQFIFYVGENRTNISTLISHGIDEYGDSLLSKMAKQLNLERRKFNDLLDCPMSEEEYFNLMIEKGVIRE